MREVLLERSWKVYPAIIAATFARGFFTHNNTVLFSLALSNRLYIALSCLSPFSLALHLALVSLFPFSLALHTWLYSISLSFPLFYLCPFSLAFYTLLYSVSRPPPSLSVLRSVLSLSLLPRSLYFAQFLSLSLLPRSLYLALFYLCPFSLTLHAAFAHTRLRLTCQRVRV